MYNALTIFHVTIENSNDRYSVTSNYITNFETCLMPHDIGLDVIERRTAYGANRAGRVSLIAHQIVQKLFHLLNETANVKNI